MINKYQQKIAWVKQHAVRPDVIIDWFKSVAMRYGVNKLEFLEAKRSRRSKDIKEDLKGCFSSGFDTNGSFYPFPKSESLKKQWILRIRRANCSPNSVVCDLHFAESDFKSAVTVRPN